MKTQKTKLRFEKNVITELQTEQLQRINGGTLTHDQSLSCTFCVNSSNGPGGVILAQLRQA